MRKNELSIFIDESGDFGEYQEYCRFYIVTFLFHNQNKDINDSISILNNSISYLGVPSNYIHAGPLIRKEDEYYKMSLIERRKALLIAVKFIRKAPIQYHSFIVDRRKYMDKNSAICELRKLIKNYLTENQAFFSSFKDIKIYYDNGQRELSNILLNGLPNILTCNTIFKTVNLKEKYRLLQIVDVICTLELINEKIKINKMSKNENIFFKTKDQFIKDYYTKILTKKI